MRTLKALVAQAVATTRSALIRARIALAPRAAFVYLVGVALIERVRTAIRRRRGARPRLIWGPVPIISIKYWSEAMRESGYESLTCVSQHYAINRREDFDVYRDQFLGPPARSPLLSDYRFFAWMLRRGDVFLRFFDGCYLRFTPLEWWEARLLKLAGKRLIVSPYGADIAVSGHLGDLEQALWADYPALAEQSEQTRRWVVHHARWADLVVRNWQLGFLPSYDVVWLNQLAIDLEHWSAAGADSGGDGQQGEVTVLHSPNHRNIKGTAHLERAVGELRDEGLAIRLEVLEGRPNEEVRAALMSTDIVADQFLLPGYAMAAVEAMAAGKPVLDNLGGLPAELQATEAFRQCPAVDTYPERLKEDLRRLVTNPELRREIGRAGREFVERFHSYEAVSRVWAEVIDHVWRGTPLPQALLPGRAATASSPAR
jgi:glycosyltransferase involved in cell wall biosynthesis